MSRFTDFIFNKTDNPHSEDTVRLNTVEGFKGNGAVVQRDRRGTRSAEIPNVNEKAETLGDDPLAIYKPTGAKSVDAAKAMANFTNWVYAGVNAIASEIANIQWRLYEINGDDHEEKDDHEVLTLLESVNEDMTGIELKYTTAAHLELTGNCFWLLDGVKDETSQPTAIYPLHPGRVRVKLDKSKFPYRVSHYEFTIDGKIFTFQKYQILHIKYPDPGDPYVGIGVPQVIPSWIDSDNYAMEYNRKFFINGAAIGLYIKSDTNVEANIERIKQGFSDAYSGTENAHKTPVLPKGAELKHTGVTHKDMDYGNLTTATRDRILAGLRVSKTILGTAESDTNRACYDDQTEVLTENGWKKYFDVKDGEKIAEYDGERNVVRFALPLGKYVYPYSGKMLHFENCKMDIMVTPDHRMWYRPDHKGADYRIARAEKLPKICYFKAAAPQNDGEQVDLFTLPYYEKGSHPEIIGRTFYMDDWLEFMGYVVSEGGISSQAKNWVITLYQKKQPHQDKMRACLKRLAASGCLNFGEYQTPGEDGARFNVHGKPIVMWMHEFVGSYSNDKKLPDFVFKLCRRQRQVLFDALMVGDGSIDPRANRKSGYYSTTSHQLADDVQRLAFSLGIEAKSTIHYEAEGNRSTCYRVTLDFGTAEQQLDYQHRNMRHEVDYDGYVWCFQTTTGLFVTRRNGKIALQGNTAETADYVFSKRTIRPKMLLIVSYLNAYLIPRYGDNIYLTFIDPVPEDKAARTTEMQAAVGSMPVITQNEARRNFMGLGPIDGGDKLMHPSTMEVGGMSLSPEGEDASPNLARAFTPEGWHAKAVRVRVGGKTIHSAAYKVRKSLTDAFKKAIDATDKQYKSKSVNEMTREEYMEHWKRFADRSDRAADALEDAFKTINHSQQKEVIANLPSATGVKKALDPSKIFDIDEWVHASVDLATPIIMSLIKDEAIAAFSMIGDNPVNILGNEIFQEKIGEGIEKMARSYNQTTLSALTDVMQEKLSQAGGTTLPELTAAVQDVYGVANSVRATMIAKTETFRAANAANKQAWLEAGTVKVIKWFTFQDDKVCPYCMAQDGKEIPIDQNFYDQGDSVEGANGEVMTASYSDIGAPPLHPLCRCYIRPVRQD